MGALANEPNEVERRHLWKRRWVGAALVLAATTSVGALGAPAAMAQPSSEISIERTAGPGQAAPCGPSVTALRYEVIDAPERFTLRIIAGVPLCEPLTAVAAVYEMPSRTIAWPQRLVERQEFTISGAETIDVQFAKTCRPAQFDVLTGNTPEVVSPWGEWHGPLLFPFDLATAFQHKAAGCGTTPTTPTTVPDDVAPTSTVPDDGGTVPSDGGGGTPDGSPGPDTEVAGVTTVPVSPGGTPSEDPARVVDAADEPPNVAGLAFTGSTASVLVAAGLALMLCGGFALVVPRLHERRVRR